ncbi:MAG: hypothetical protein JWN34_659 [Bryobacterales bacterium]|nr:hypothetical protein [Bryobacterales bacterium]
MKIKAFPQGNQVGVLLGPDPVQGFSGIRDDLPAAPGHLAVNLRSEPGEYEAPKCKKLGAEVRRIVKPQGKIYLAD